MPGTLFVVATPIGNLEDITARALRVLREANLIAAEDTRRTARLLARYAIATPSTSFHQHNEHQKAQSIISRLERGENVALVSDAGTPAISDPGERLVREARAAGIRVEAVPGPSAVVATLSASGFPSSTFTFLGFPPTRSKDRKKWLSDLAEAGRTVVFFEAPHRIRRTLEDVRAVVGNCRVCLARELTKAHEELVVQPIEDALTSLGEPRGEFTVAVELGHLTNVLASKTASAPLDPQRLLQEFGELTNIGGARRRAAIGILARRYTRTPNDVYDALERAKKLVE